MKYNYFINETWRGYIAGYSYNNGYRDVNHYVKSIYNNKIVYTLDYTYARYYKTRRAAAAALELIRKDIGK